MLVFLVDNCVPCIACEHLRSRLQVEEVEVPKVSVGKGRPVPVRLAEAPLPVGYFWQRDSVRLSKPMQRQQRQSSCQPQILHELNSARRLLGSMPDSI